MIEVSSIFQIHLDASYTITHGAVEKKSPVTSMLPSIARRSTNNRSRTHQLLGNYNDTIRCNVREWNMEGE